MHSTFIIYNSAFIIHNFFLYIPHGHCYLWQPGLVWLHLISDILTALAYYSIPITLLYFVRKRQDLPFNWIFLLFGAFIIACGTSHLMAVWTLWHPTYWLSGAIKAVTAAVSAYTAIVLVCLIPQALVLPSPAQLATANQQLQQQIVERQRAQAALTKAHDDLEMRVVERTAELLASNEALRQSEERWQLALRGNSDGIWDWNIKMNDVFFSPRWKEMLGYADDEIPNNLDEWAKRVHPDDLGWVTQAILDHFAKKTPFYITEHRVQCKDGSYKWILDRGQALWDEDGNALRMVGSHTDITERKRTEVALRQSEATLRSFFDSAPMMMGVVELLESDILHISDNATAARFFGMTPEAMQNRLASDMGASPEYINKWIERYRQAEQTQSPISFEYPHTTPNSQKWLKATVAAIAMCDAHHRRFSYVVEDITERKQAEAELRHLSNALASAVEGISQLDTQGRYIAVNPAYASMVGYQPEEMIGMVWQPTVHPDDLEKMIAAYQRMLVDGKVEVEARGVRKDGTVFDKQLVMVTAYDQRQQFIGHYCFMKDISDRREIDRLKDEFVSVVSHELRTPLTSISGALDLLASGILQNQPVDAQRMLQIAANNTDRLVRLINDILDIERIESGKVQMTKVACNAADLMTQSVELLQEMAQKAGVTLAVTPLSASLWADGDRIIQVLTNLLSNAIKYSSTGSTVWLNAELQAIGEGVGESKSRGAGEQGNKGDRGDKGGQEDKGELITQNSGLRTQDSALSTQNSGLRTPTIIRFQITDTGRGIPADKLESIFERFQQVDASDSRQKGGTGLGLAICRSILQHHDGRIWVESTLGVGSTFYFTLPLWLKQGVAPQKGEDENISLSSSLMPNAKPALPPLVLQCDDDSSIRTVVQTLLEQQGYRVLAVSSGREALAQAIAQHPAVILLNLRMPEMDGWETLAALKQHPETQNIPVIILSGLLPDANQGLPLGVSDWIVKPPTLKLLCKALEKAVNSKHQIMKVLVIEDDQDLAQVLTAMFNRHGIATSYAQTGKEAIQVSQRVIPDLLVLDLGLPECDGFAVVDWLRQHNRLCQVPLIVYTAQDLDEDDRDRLKLGQTLFLTKGRISPQEFEQRVINLLNRMILHENG